jgi:hypothetical protein
MTTSSSRLAGEVKTCGLVHPGRRGRDSAAVDPRLEAGRVAPRRIPGAAQQELLGHLQANDQPIAFRRGGIAAEAIDSGVEIDQRAAQHDDLLLPCLALGRLRRAIRHGGDLLAARERRFACCASGRPRRRAGLLVRYLYGAGEGVGHDGSAEQREEDAGANA